MELNEDEVIEQFPEKISEAKENVSKRFAILVYPEVQQEFAKLAKQYKVSQSVVAKTLLDIVDRQKLDDVLKIKYVEKMDNRTSKTALLKRLSGLSAEQLAELLNKSTALKNESFYG